MENENVVVIEENDVVEGKNSSFHWGKFWAWSSIVFSVILPVVGLGVGILALSMTDEENVDEIYNVALVGVGIGAFFFTLDLVLGLVNLF